MTRILRTIPLLYRNLLSRMAGFVSEREGTLWSAAVIGVVLIGSILSWRFWDKLGGNAESFSTTLRDVALVIGGVAAILLALWRSRVSERQTAIAQRQNETAQHQAEIARNSLLNERYQRGAEMLGSEILSARLGGIYALQRTILSSITYESSAFSVDLCVNRQGTTELRLPAEQMENTKGTHRLCARMFRM